MRGQRSFNGSASRLFRSCDAGRPAKAAGIAPRLEPGETARGFGPSRAQAGLLKGLRSLRWPEETAGLRPAGSATGALARITVLSEASRRVSSRGFGLSTSPPDAERGLAACAPGSEESEAGLAPASRSEAAQREMASPPSDGSQSWDKWGPVATPAPILIPASIADPHSRPRRQEPARSGLVGLVEREERRNV